MASKNDVNTPVLVLIGFLGALATFAIVTLLIVLFYSVQNYQNRVKVIDVAPAELNNLIATQQAQLTSYRLVDPEKKMVSIPVSRAMDLVVAELSRKAPAPSVSNADATEPASAPSNSASAAATSADAIPVDAPPAAADHSGETP